MTHSRNADTGTNPVRTKYVLARFPEWTVREYANGMYDAVQGIAISPGFETYSDLLAWLREEESREVAGHSRRV